MNSVWKPDRLLRFLLYWTSFTTLVFWLPLIRGAFDGASYRWAFAPGIHGAGLSGAYWAPASGAILSIVTLVLGWRGARRPFHWFLLTWHLALAAGTVYLSIVFPDQFRLQGDTLGVSFSLAPVGPLLLIAILLVVIFWVQRPFVQGGAIKRFVGLRQIAIG